MACITMDSPIGILWIREQSGAIAEIRFAGKKDRIPWPMDQERETPLLNRCVKQLEEYFRGDRREFDLPVEPGGTAFQQRVYQELRKIPYGERRSYKDVAIAAGSPNGMRAVGGANHRNPVPILVPCHRVVGADGRLVGYAGGLSIKEWLLHHEGAAKDPSLDE